MLLYWYENDPAKGTVQFLPATREVREAQVRKVVCGIAISAAVAATCGVAMVTALAATGFLF